LVILVWKQKIKAYETPSFNDLGYVHAVRGGMMESAHAQSGCNNNCDAPQYCITNRNVDCNIDVKFEVVCPSGFQETFNLQLNATTCQLSPTQKCVDFPSCDCSVQNVTVEGQNVTVGHISNCVNCGGGGAGFNVALPADNVGMCIDYLKPQCGSFECP
jgi:hypothetical protein